MKSFAGSIFYVGGGVSSYLASFLISTVHRTTEHSPTGNWLAEDLNKAKLDYFYFMLTGLMFVNFLYFLLMARWYRYKGTHDEVSYVVDTVDEETKQQDKNSVWFLKSLLYLVLILQTHLCCCTSIDKMNEEITSTFWTCICNVKFVLLISNCVRPILFPPFNTAEQDKLE